MKKYFKETVKYILRSKLFIHKYIVEIDKLYNMSPTELKLRNEKVFLNIFKEAYNKSPFYHKLYTEHGIKINDIKCLEDINKLPIITKDMIKRHTDEIPTKSKYKLIKNHTSGTTGTPLTVYEDWPSIWREQAYFYCYRKRCGYEYGKDIIASLRGHLDRNTNSLYINISKTLFLSSYNLSDKVIQEYFILLKKYKPQAIEGYPSSLYNLARLLEKNNFDITIPLAFTSSETLDINKRQYIERILHTKIFDHYGNTERTIRLEETKEHNGYYEDPGYSINEYKTEHIITTSLINSSFPMIRYRVDDIIQLKANAKRDSVTEPTIQGIDGRTTDCIIGLDGTNFSGAALTYFAKAIPNIQTVQLIQSKIGYMDICIVPNKEFSKKDNEDISNVVDKIFGLNNINYIIKIIEPADLQYSKNGKLSLVVSFRDKNNLLT